MDRFLVAVAIGSIVVVIATVFQRRQNDPPTNATTSYEAPAQIDRNDFAHPDRPWAVIAFVSETCQTCADIWQKVSVLESNEVAVQAVEATADKELHNRYSIDAVPIVVLCDAEGVVQKSFLGPTSAVHLWAGLAELREPGSTPADCNHGGEQLKAHEALEPQ